MSAKRQLDTELIISVPRHWRKETMLSMLMLRIYKSVEALKSYSGVKKHIDSHRE